MESPTLPQVFNRIIGIFAFATLAWFDFDETGTKMSLSVAYGCMAILAIWLSLFFARSACIVASQESMHLVAFLGIAAMLSSAAFSAGGVLSLAAFILAPVVALGWILSTSMSK